MCSATHEGFRFGVMEKRKGDAVKHRQCIENFWEEEFSNRHLGGTAYK